MTDTFTEQLEAEFAAEREAKSNAEKKAVSNFKAGKLVASKEANALRMMTPLEANALRVDITNHGGLRKAIMVNLRSEIVDGRNRVKALMDLGMDLRAGYVVALDDEMIGKDYVHALNAVRRQLSADELKDQIGDRLDGLNDVSKKILTATQIKDWHENANRKHTETGSSRDVDPAVSINKLVCEAIGCKTTKATTLIKKAAEKLGIEVKRGKRWTQSEVNMMIPEIKKIIKQDKPKPKPKPKTKAAPKPVEPSVTFADIPDEPDVDSLKEALAEEGIEYTNPKERMPSIKQAVINMLDIKLTGLNPAQKRVVRKHIKDEVRRQVQAQVFDAVNDEKARLNAATNAYGGKIEGAKEDVRTVRNVLHSDKFKSLTPEKLDNALGSFNRMINERR